MLLKSSSSSSPGINERSFFGAADVVVFIVDGGDVADGRVDDEETEVDVEPEGRRVA
jgi:hypothetical protein